MQFLLQIVDREKRVAFIGISNWALDPATKELELSAR